MTRTPQAGEQVSTGVDEGAPPQTAPPMATWKLLLIVVVVWLVLGAIMFGLAGTLDLPWLWAALGVFATCHLALAVIVFRHDPDLAKERLKPGPGAPGWDRVVLGLGALLMFAGLVLGPLDVGRFHWSDTVAWQLKAAGLAGLVAGMALITWAMRVNTFFSKVVRIQKERGHRVIREGPYGIVRHPGYVGWNLLWIGFSLALGSWIAVAAAGGVAITILVRTALEDRFLQRNLEGYSDYTREVRYRLIPGVW